MNNGRVERPLSFPDRPAAGAKPDQGVSSNSDEPSPLSVT